MCKRWKVISEMSWMDLKSLTDDMKTWGMRPHHNEIPYVDFLVMFKCVIRRCDRYLTHLAFNTFEMGTDIINLVKEECSNLQDIDILNFQHLKFFFSNGDGLL